MGNDLDKLAAPKLFGRKKKPKQEDASPAGTAAGEATTERAPEPVADTAFDPASEPVPGLVPEPLLDTVPEPISDAALEPATGTTVRTAPQPVLVADEPAEPAPRRVRRPLSVPGPLAALLAGVAAGAVLSGLTWAAEAATDPADSGRIQAVMVVAIFVLSVVAGALVLRLLRVTSPGTIAFLGSALVALVAVVALNSHFDDAVGAVAGVVLSALAYPLARWVTVRYIDAA